MATSAGKTILLVLIITFLMLILFRGIPFLFGLFHIFPHMLGTNLPHIGFGLPGSITLLLPTLLLTLLWFVIIIWVYRDAEQRGMNGILWGLLVFVGNIIGLLVYLIVRNDGIPQLVAPSSAECQNCSKSVSRSFAYCPHCGVNMKPICPSCSKSIAKDWEVCPYCGAKLTK